LVEEKKISDFEDVKDKHSVYIFGGLKDDVVPNGMSVEQQRLFESVKYDVKVRYEAEFQHWFLEKEAAGTISNHVYKDLDGWSFTPYEIDETYKTSGLLGKWDQQTLLDDMVSNGEKSLKLDQLGLRKWGLYYIPTACASKRCNMQLILHGCTRPAEEMVKYWAPMAAKNDIVVVFPQAKSCWDTKQKYIAKDSDLQKFMLEIVKTS